MFLVKYSAIVPNTKPNLNQDTSKSQKSGASKNQRCKKKKKKKKEAELNGCEEF